jgi:hypothetical protein
MVEQGIKKKKTKGLKKEEIYLMAREETRQKNEMQRRKGILIGCELKGKKKEKKKYSIPKEGTEITTSSNVTI